MREADFDVALLNKQYVLNVLRAHRDRFDEFSVRALFLFGSVARDEATAESDVDLLVEFERPVGLFTFLGLRDCLEELLGHSVDLGTPNSLQSYLLETVLEEAIRAI